MYFHNSDGSLIRKDEGYQQHQSVVQPQQTTSIETITSQDQPHNNKPHNDSPHNDTPHNDTPHNKKENFLEGYKHLFKRHRNCNCMDCWKNFVLMTIFYAIIIYLLYLLTSAFFNKKE